MTMKNSQSQVRDVAGRPRLSTTPVQWRIAVPGALDDSGISRLVATYSRTSTKTVSPISK